MFHLRNRDQKTFETLPGQNPEAFLDTSVIEEQHAHTVEVPQNPDVISSEILGNTNTSLAEDAGQGNNYSTPVADTESGHGHLTVVPKKYLAVSTAALVGIMGGFAPKVAFGQETATTPTTPAETTPAPTPTPYPIPYPDTPPTPPTPETPVATPAPTPEADEVIIGDNIVSTKNYRMTLQQLEDDFKSSQADNDKPEDAISFEYYMSNAQQECRPQNFIKKISLTRKSRDKVVMSVTRTVPEYFVGDSIYGEGQNEKYATLCSTIFDMSYTAESWTDRKSSRKGIAYPGKTPGTKPVKLPNVLPDLLFSKTPVDKDDLPTETVTNKVTIKLPKSAQIKNKGYVALNAAIKYKPGMRHKDLPARGNATGVYTTIPQKVSNRAQVVATNGRLSKNTSEYSAAN